MFALILLPTPVLLVGVVVMSLPVQTKDPRAADVLEILLDESDRTDDDEDRMSGSKVGVRLDWRVWLTLCLHMCLCPQSLGECSVSGMVSWEHRPP